MTTKLINKLSGNQFLKDSSILFAVNIVASLFNFALQPVASRILGNQFDLWVSLTSLITIFLTLISGITTEIVKNTSKLSKQSSLLPFEYYFFVKKLIVKFSLVLLLIATILVFPLNEILKIYDLKLTALTLFYICLVALTGFNQSFLLGLLVIKKYSTSNIFNSLLRFFVTVGLFIWGIGVLGLPLGFIASAVFTYFFTEFLLNQELSHRLSTTGQKLGNHPFSAKEIIQGFLHTGLILFGLSSLFLLPSAVARSVLNTEPERNLFAVLAFFGQIIFFGSTSFLSGLISHAAKQHSKKIYLTALGIVSVISAGVGLGLWILGPFLLKIMDKEAFIQDLPLILVYTLFIAFYNLIYVSVQYLIATNQSEMATTVFIWIFFLICGLILISAGILDTLQPNRVVSLVGVNLLTAFCGAIFYFVKIYFSKDNS